MVLMKVNKMTKRILAAIVIVWIAGAFVSAATPQSGEAYRTSAEIRINLPEGVDPTVEVYPGSSHIIVELPQGSQFPMDFSASTGGLIRSGNVTTVSEGRVRLDLDVALGLLNRVVYEPGAVVLRFESRFEVQGHVEQSTDDYRLGPDDEISITVHGQPDLNADLTITRGGFITAPLIGDVEASGLTRRQLALRLAELLGRDFLVDPQVDVVIENFQSQWVMVAGEVRVPGRVALKGGTRLKEVLSEAGGFAETSGEVISVTRKIPDSEEGASVDIDRWDFEAGNLNPILQDGDIVSISKAKYAYLQGEVGSPGRIRIERGMTLLRALSQGGGLTDWANKKKIEIIAEEGGQPKSYNLKQIQKGESSDPTLFGGEIIVVKRRFF